MRRLTWALALFALSVLTTACEREPDASSRRAPVASIATDQGDYPPGHLVTFTGRGGRPAKQSRSCCSEHRACTTTRS